MCGYYSTALVNVIFYNKGLMILQKMLKSI